MEKFTGTKEILARPMTRLEYNQYRGWELPADENGADTGMLVEYIDGGASNHPDHAGYISWSPTDVFDRAYRPSATFLDRMVIERDELKVRYAKLVDFVHRNPMFDELDTEDQRLLKEQVSSMADYLRVLSERVRISAKKQGIDVAEAPDA